MSNISIKRIIREGIISENPNVNFISDSFDSKKMIIHNGEKVELSNFEERTISYSDLKRFLDKTKSKIIVNYIWVALLIFISSSIGTVVTFGESFLPKEPNFWKYMIFQFSLFLAYIIGFMDISSIKHFKNNWTQKCIKNQGLFNSFNSRKCSLPRTKDDLDFILSNIEIHQHEEEYFPYGTQYFNKVIKEIKKIKKLNNLEDEYIKELSKINSSPNLFKSIISLVLGVCIQIFSFVDLYNVLTTFRGNMIGLLILVPIMSFFFSEFVVAYLFNKAYIRLDAKAYVYSYAFLQMPFDLQDGINSNDENEAAYYAQEKSKEINRHVCVRDMIKTSNGWYFFKGK